jgi:integrase
LLSTHLTDFLQTKRRKWRPKTREVYTSILNLYVAHVGLNHWPPTRQGVLSWLDAVELAGNSQTTINTYWTHVRTFLNYLEKIGALASTDNPVRQLVALELEPEPEDLPPIAFPPEDLVRLFEFLDAEAAKGDLYAIRDRAVLRLAYVTGIREGELAALSFDQLDLDQCEVSILAGTSKSKKHRPVYFDDQAARDLEAWLDVRPNRAGVQQVFVSLGGRVPRGSSIKPHALYDLLERRCFQVGIQRRKFHALRHSSALDALDEGISADKVQKQLGHTSLKTTLRYLRGRDEDRAQAYRNNSLSDSLARRAALRQEAQQVQHNGRRRNKKTAEGIALQQ